MAPAALSLSRQMYLWINTKYSLIKSPIAPTEPLPPRKEEGGGGRRGPLTQRTRRVCTAINALSNAILTAIIFFVTRYNRTATEINISCGRTFDQERSRGGGGEGWKANLHLTSRRPLHKFFLVNWNSLRLLDSFDAIFFKRSILIWPLDRRSKVSDISPIPIIFFFLINTPNTCRK